MGGGGRGSGRGQSFFVPKRSGAEDPEQQGDGLGIQFDDLAQEMTHRRGGPQVVMVFKLTVEPGTLRVGLDPADRQGCARAAG
jgi:hypothetical protein